MELALGTFFAAVLALGFPGLFAFVVWTAVVFLFAIWWFREQMKARPEWVVRKIAEGKVLRDRLRTEASIIADASDELAIKWGIKDPPTPPPNASGQTGPAEPKL